MPITLEQLAQYRIFRLANQEHHYWGRYEEYVVVNKKTGIAIAHFRVWEDPHVRDDWNPVKNGVVNRVWKLRRPEGFTEICTPEEREYTLDWALGCLADMRVPV